MSWLREALTGEKAAAPGEERLAALETHVRALYDETEQGRRDHRALVLELQQLRQDEARRAAEHATMMDSLSRLYRRVAARIDREHQVAVAKAEAHTNGEGESVADMRRRLGR